MGVAWQCTRKRSSHWRAVVAVAAACSVAMIVGAAAMRLFIIPSLIRMMVLKDAPLTEGTRTLKGWRDPTYKFDFKVWVYSVKNPDDVLQGAVPEVRAIGPYVFDKFPHQEITRIGNGTVAFKRRSLHFFNESESCAECFLGNRIWIPNLIYQKFVEVASKPAMRATATTLLAQTPFLELQVGDMLFNGYKDPFIQKFCDVPFVNVICQTVFDLPERIGLLYGQNNSYFEGEFVVKDGSFDIMERAEMLSYNGMSHLKEAWWTTPEAREIRGTEGTIFHPFIDKSETLYTFGSQLCRTMELNFEKEIDYRGMTLFRYVVGPAQFDASTYAGGGFCHGDEKQIFPEQMKPRRDGGKTGCYPPGLIQISRCQRNEPPVVMSMPNFNFAPDYVRKSIKGMNETDQERDRIIVDIEPTLGIVVRVDRHIQINGEFWAGVDIPIPSFHRTQRSAIIPMMVVHDDAEIDDKTFDLIWQELYVGRRIAYGASTLLFVLGLILGIVAIVYAFFMSRQGSKFRPSAFQGSVTPSSTSSKAVLQSRGASFSSGRSGPKFY